MIKFSLAGYYSKYPLNMMILSLYKLKKEYFYDNIEIDSVYGSLPGMIFTGCRFIYPIKEIDPFNKDVYLLKESYNDFNIKMRHTFTNIEITQDMLGDFRCNEWLRACEKRGNAVIVASDIMANYIRKNYPSYEIFWSTSTGIKNIEEINKKTEQDMVVLDYYFNNKDELLKQLKNPQKIELMCSERCIDNCPLRQKHYKVHSKMILNSEKDRFLESQCPFFSKNDSNFYDFLKNRKHCLTHERIEYLYNNFNINHFKLNGREVTAIDYIEILMYYLIKPECRDYVRQIMLLGYYEK